MPTYSINNYFNEIYHINRLVDIAAKELAELFDDDEEEFRSLIRRYVIKFYDPMTAHRTIMYLINFDGWKYSFILRHMPNCNPIPEYFHWKVIENKHVFRVKTLDEINTEAIKFMRDNFTHKFYFYHDSCEECWIIAFDDETEFILFTLVG